MSAIVATAETTEATAAATASVGSDKPVGGACLGFNLGDESDVRTCFFGCLVDILPPLLLLLVLVLLLPGTNTAAAAESFGGRSEERAAD